MPCRVRWLPGSGAAFVSAPQEASSGRASRVHHLRGSAILAGESKRGGSSRSVSRGRLSPRGLPAGGAAVSLVRAPELTVPGQHGRQPLGNKPRLPTCFGRATWRPSTRRTPGRRGIAAPVPQNHQGLDGERNTPSRRSRPSSPLSRTSGSEGSCGGVHAGDVPWLAGRIAPSWPTIAQGGRARSPRRERGARPRPSSFPPELARFIDRLSRMSGRKRGPRGRSTAEKARAKRDRRACARRWASAA